MKRSLWSVLVLSLAIGLIGWREWNRPPATAATPSPSATPAKKAQVVLFINLGEVDEAEGCGEIIRSARDAAKRGVALEEIDTRNESPAPERYRLVVAPTVLILDAAGAEVKRFEGESPKTVREIRSSLDKLSPSR